MTPEEYNELQGLIADFISKNGKELKNYEFDEELHKKAKEETQQYMEYLKNQEHLERCLKLWN
jgi:hypothetical protein